MKYVAHAVDDEEPVILPFEECAFFEASMKDIREHWDLSSGGPRFTVEVGDVEHIVFQSLVD